MLFRLSVSLFVVPSFSLSLFFFFGLLVLFTTETFELNSSLIFGFVSFFFIVFIHCTYFCCLKKQQKGNFLAFFESNMFITLSVFFFNSGFSGYLRHFKVHS